ncbi:hypothetical protein ACIBCU_06820 [Streptomyces sp. NPDC051064]|uniref:hypothetical protein n=1 Tax=Streptomyces sp. NPDC051064 TaxID=3365641 RepID=UPI00379727F7
MVGREAGDAGMGRLRSSPTGVIMIALPSPVGVCRAVLPAMFIWRRPGDEAPGP